MSEDHKDHVDRLLDEGLKHYSRVEPPEDFAEKVREAAERAGKAAERKVRWWLWAPVPAALAMLLFVTLMRQAPAPQRPSAAATPSSAPAPSAHVAPAAPQARPAPMIAAVHPARAAAARPARVPVVPRRPRGPRVLTPEELARMAFPAEMFAAQQAEQLAIPDLAIPELKIPALEPLTQEPKGSAFDDETKEQKC